MTHAQFVALAVSWLAATGIPAVVDLTTKSHLSHRIKAGVALVLACLDGALATSQISAGESWATYALAILGAFIVALGTHLTGYSDPIQARTAAVGIGPSSPPADPLGGNDVAA